ncbi:major head protein [Arthrobacter phage Shoya]|uniref:Major capsid protein n=1 Tax=Arthrobacter phage Shoya TaxID=2704035 RepID=A0A6G6XI33_9CAUD|nr:major head protein [Arthrobacter phage Shoya]QIG57676.1 major capsid protein [Arthrobacter phage Shoya]
MNLKEKRAAALKAAQEIIDGAKAATRDLTADEKSTVEAKFAEVDGLDTQIKAAADSDAIMARLGSYGAPAGGDGDREAKGAAKSLGEHFVKSVGERLTELKGTRYSLTAPEFKAATDTQLVGTALSAATTDVDTNIVSGVRRRLTVADLLGTGTLTGNAITYFIEGALEGDFTTVAEGAAKPQLHFADPTPVTEALKKIAAFIKESDEMVEDLPFLVSSINNRLLYQLGLFEENQLLNGNGTGTNVRGLLNRSGIQTLGAGTDAKAGNPDTLFKAITNVQTGSGLDADGIMINPTDYQALRLSKDANGQYFGGGFFAGQYGNGGIVEQPPLWGLSTVVTPAIAAGTVLVGAFQQSSTLYRKGGVRVESTNSEGNDFTNNKITIRAEERIALATRVPAGLVKVTLGTA